MQLICPSNSREEPKLFLICLISSMEEEMCREVVFRVILSERKASGGRPRLIKHMKDHSIKVSGHLPLPD